MAAVSKKRTVGEMTKPNGSSSGKKTVESGKSADNVSAATLWIEKHAPRSVEELVINKKKVGEFIEIAE